MAGTCEILLERLRNDGGKILVTLTIIEAIFYLGYTIFFAILYDDINPGSQYEVDPSQWYKWVTFVILLVGQVYFLASSTVGKSKNPNELYSYLALAIFTNLLFLAILCYYSYYIKKNWINDPNEIEEELSGKILAIWILGLALLALVVILMILIAITTEPLKQRIYEEIFWEIGANMNMVEIHKATTLFKGVCKVDLFTHLVFLNTFVFLNYNYA